MVQLDCFQVELKTIPKKNMKKPMKKELAFLLALMFAPASITLICTLTAPQLMGEVLTPLGIKAVPLVWAASIISTGYLRMLRLIDEKKAEKLDEKEEPLLTNSSFAFGIILWLGTITLESTLRSIYLELFNYPSSFSNVTIPTSEIIRQVE